jgi:hypothetical protein
VGTSGSPKIAPALFQLRYGINLSQLYKCFRIVYLRDWTLVMDKAMNILRRELGDLERLMRAIETALERNHSGTSEPAADSSRTRDSKVFGHDPALSLRLD